jgi:hypothetical protein
MRLVEINWKPPFSMRTVIRAKDATEARLLRAEVIDFVRWLNHEVPERPGWDRAECLLMLRAPDFSEIWQDLTGQAKSEMPTDEWVSGIDFFAALRTEQRRVAAVRHMENITRVENVVLYLDGKKKKLRECACDKCGKWFLPTRQDQLYYGDHRKRVWQQGAPPDRKERRRIQNKNNQARWRQRTFKADTSAQIN